MYCENLNVTSPGNQVDVNLAATLIALLLLCLMTGSYGILIFIAQDNRVKIRAKHASNNPDLFETIYHVKCNMKI